MIHASFFAFLLMSAAPAPAGPEGPIALRELRACQSVAPDKDRLACYDRAAAALNKSVESNEVFVLDQQDVKKTKRSLFGFTLPRISIFGGGRGTDREEAEITQIDTKVGSVRSLGNGKFSFTTDEGATWQTTDPSPDLPKPGEKVTIKRAALGSYFIRFERQRPLKGKRVG